MNKGFALVELLAVLVILTALFLLTSTLVGPVLDNSKESLSEVQIKKIEESAKAYYLKEGLTGEQYVLDETKTCVNVSDLIDNGYIDKDEIIEPESGEKITGSIKIIYRANNYSYEYQDKTCSKKDMGIICEAVEETTVGTIPEGNFIPGDKYECEVKPETIYNFYVLSTQDDKVNLIMDSNICADGTAATETNTCLIEWINQEDYEISGGNTWNSWLGHNEYGPLTAMKYLYNATTLWTNVPALNYEYYEKEWQESLGLVNEENKGYESFTSVDGEGKINGIKFTETDPLRARMPIYASKYDDNSEYGDVADFNGINGYLYENLSSEYWIHEGGQPTNNIENIFGYWTLSSLPNSDIKASFVSYSGVVFSNDIYDSVYPSVYGVRPVISLYKFQLG